MHQNHKEVAMETESLMDFMKEDKDEEELSKLAELDDEAWKELERALTEYDHPSCMSGI